MSFYYVLPRIETADLYFFQTLMFPNQDYDRMSVSEDGSLIIDPVRKEDTGEYICKALSLAGSAYAKAKLEVRGMITETVHIIHFPSISEVSAEQVDI
jgi:hypothetical protein